MNTFFRTVASGAALLFSLPALQAALPVTDGLILDLQLSAAVLDNGKVVGISDLSGLGNNAGGGVAPDFLAAATPTGLGAMSFDGASQYLEVAGSSAFDGRAKTTFVVFRPTVLGTGRMFNSAYSTVDPVNSPDTAHHAVHSAFANASGGGVFRIQNRNATGGGVSLSTPNGTVAPEGFYLGVNLWHDNGDVAAIVLNEAGERARSTATGATADPQGHLWTRLGAGSGTSNPNPQDYFHGDIATLIVFNRALNETELALMEDHLYQTYLIPEPATVSLMIGMLAVSVAFFRRRLIK